MSDFYRRFLTEDGRRLEPETGRYVALGAFGKHPGWDDHIEDLGLDTDSLNLAKRVFYVLGVGGQIDTGAWEKLKEEQRLGAFDHTFVWLRGSQFLMGRMWSSSDGKGRTRYPMIICAHCVGVPLKWALQMILPRLIEVEQECRVAKTASEVRAILDGARSRLRNAARTATTGLESETIGPGALSRFVSAPVFGPTNEGWLRLIYWLQSQVSAFAPGRYELKEDMSVYRTQEARVPLGAESPAEAIPLWAKFLNGYVDPRVPLFFVWPADANWVDIAFGEPTTQEFFCLRASRAAIPLTTEIPYDIDDKFRDRAAQRLTDFQNGVTSTRTITGANEGKTSTGTTSVTQRWFKGFTGRFLIAFLVLLLLGGVTVGIIYLHAPGVPGARRSVQPMPVTPAKPVMPTQQVQQGTTGKKVPLKQAQPAMPSVAPDTSAGSAGSAQTAAVTQNITTPKTVALVKTQAPPPIAEVTPPPTNKSAAKPSSVGTTTAVVSAVAPATNEKSANPAGEAVVTMQSPARAITNGIGMVLLWVAGLPDSGDGGWVAKYEVTQAEYEKVTGSNPSEFKDPAQPVENVSWNEASNFCKKLNAAERGAGRLPQGFAYALPTQQQWDFFLGDTKFDQAVTSRDQSGVRASPLRVGTKPPNQYGLCDVLGNVWEWCADSESPGQKVLKGGAYNNGKIFQFRPLDRTTVRLAQADMKSPDAGFRCVLDRQP